MLRDWRAMVELLRELYPKDRTVRLAYEYYFNDRHKSRLVRRANHGGSSCRRTPPSKKPSTPGSRP